MRNTQCITKCYLGYLCYSHEVEKTERLRYSKVKISIRKRPHVTRICVLHKVVDFLFFLGFSQDINFCPFGRNWGWEGLPWNSWYHSHSVLSFVSLVLSGLADVRNPKIPIIFSLKSLIFALKKFLCTFRVPQMYQVSQYSQLT